MTNAPAISSSPPTAATGTAGSPRIFLMGMNIDCITQRAALDRITQALAQKIGGWVITPNLDQLRLFRKKINYRRFYADATLVLADGMPLVWASRLINTPLPERVPGSGLILQLTAAAAKTGSTIFLLGGNPGIAEAAAKIMREKYPGLKIAGTLCPPMGFDKDPAQIAAIEKILVDTQPDIVYACLSFPKQEIVIEDIRDKMPHTWFFGLGISLSFITGEVVRAPAWMQNTGLEWLHRLIQEPRRLFKRYILLDLPFAVRLFTWALLNRGRKPDKTA